MGWGNKEIELPDELKGKSSEEIKTFLAAQKQELADAKALATTKEAEAAASKTEHQKVQERLTALEANRTTQTQTNQTQTQTTEKTSFLVDEDAAFNERVAPLVQFTLAQGAMTARMTALQSIPAIEKRLFEKYSAEVEGIMAKESPERKAFPATWLNAWTYVKGLHTQELVAAAQKGENAFFVESVGSSGNVKGSQNDAADAEALTQQEIDIAKKMKISPEAFLARKKGLQVYVG